MAITVAMINDLRQRTNAGMMDCKKALTTAAGDIEAAVKILREKGLAIMNKRADKESKEGIVQVAASADGKTVAMVEVNTETDFVAKTDNFKKFVGLVAKTVLEKGEDIGDALKNEHQMIVSQTGENVKIRRAARYTLQGLGKIESYIHMGGKVGVLVELACGKPETVATEPFQTLVHDLALQIAASAPRYIVSAEVPSTVIDAEKEIYTQQLKDDPKFAKMPEPKRAQIIPNILKGKVNKFFTEICLVDQPFVKEPKQNVQSVIKAAQQATGDNAIAVKRYVRFQLGAAQ